MDRFVEIISNIFQPMLIPCYVFLLMMPQRIMSIRNAGIAGRRQQRNMFMPNEILKRIAISILIFICIFEFFTSQSN
jgi:hypothetical protein